MTRIFHRQTDGTYPVAARGEGIYIVDTEGRRYLDASGGAAVSCLGHDDPEVIQAIKDQVDRLPFAHTAFFTTQAAEELAEDLISKAPPGLGRAYLVCGGSEAVESALKMARQYFVELGEPGRRHVIARRQSYHGSTLGALSAGSNLGRRQPFEPLLLPTHHIGPCHAYRGQRADEDAAAYGRRAADELEAAILGLEPGSVAAFIAETVVGATVGAVPPAPGYFDRIRQICDRYGVLLILDEVMCGMGRTGTLHACEQEGIAPDLIAIGKGLGAGYQPIGAVLVASRVYEAFARGTRVFRHGHTYMGHPAACAAALAVQRAIQERGLLDNVRRRGDDLRQGLRRRFGANPFVGDIRGRGLFQAIELVRDRATKEPFDPAQAMYARIKAEAMARGLICYPGGGTADGMRGDHVLIAPPYVVTAEEIGIIVDRLGEAVEAALAAVQDSARDSGRRKGAA